METEELAAWRERRGNAIAQHAAADERRRAAETGQARRLVAEFVRAALEQGLRSEPLTAIAYNGRAGYRTGLRGWYVHRSRSVAVSVDGDFYVLSVPADFKARFTGVRLTPSDPKLIVGEGARDGESMPLQALLRNRLAAGDDWQ